MKVVLLPAMKNYILILLLFATAHAYAQTADSAAYYQNIASKEKELSEDYRYVSILWAGAGVAAVGMSVKFTLQRNEEPAIGMLVMAAICGGAHRILWKMSEKHAIKSNEAHMKSKQYITSE
jgi:hypothetical protein